MGFGAILWTAICYVLFAVCSIDAIVSIAVGGGVWIWDILLALLFCPIPRFRAWKRLQVSKLFGRVPDPKDELHVVQPEDIPPLEVPETKSQSAPQESELLKPPIPEKTTSIPDAVFAKFDDDGAAIVPMTAGGIPMAYHYKDVGIYSPPNIDVDFSQIDLGLRATFRFEPDNPYDKDAVAVYVGQWRVGYMNRGRLRDMLVDWVRQGNPFWAAVSSVDDEKRKIRIFLAFYRESHRAYDDYDDDDFDDYDLDY